MINKLIDRVSSRDYDGKEIEAKDLDLLKKVINNSPTSTNAQQFSSIIITDQELKDWFSEMNWGQKHLSTAGAFVLFLADRSRLNNGLKGKEFDDSITDHEQYRGVVDATIAATYAQDAMLSLGYGVCFIGGVMTFADKIVEKLNLPKDVFPIVGITIGKTTKDNATKPKVNKVYMNEYDVETVKSEQDAYEKIMQEYYGNRGDSHGWLSAQYRMVGNGDDKKPLESFIDGSNNIKKFRKEYK